ncbi:MAG: RluA family pseudouridine synthase [Candidatus Limiplasma sp.]|nr:RluA family pseudouridine synthase [Candidatus Limiplasma sp.]
MERMSGEAPRSGRLDVLLSELFGCSRSACAKAIAQGRVRVDGQPAAKASQGVAAGALVEMQVPAASESPVGKEDIPIQILYQDQELAVVVKPYGMVVHPAAGNESGTLVNALLFALDGLSGIGGVKRPGIVHRLDKDTSGLLLIAKNDAAHLALSKQLAGRTMDKHYLAVVEGAMKEQSGLVDAPIARSQRDRKKMAPDPQGREALTRWRLLEAMKDCSLLDVKIETGRTHQIRVHMRHIHHPIAGDPLYGQKNGVKAPRLMLHAGYLCFDHPRTGERMGFTAPPPQEWTSAARKLGLGEGTLERWALELQSQTAPTP